MKVSRSYEELRSAIDDYLADSTVDSQSRSRSKELECGPCDGLASKRAATALSNLVRYQCLVP